MNQEIIYGPIANRPQVTNRLPTCPTQALENPLLFLQRPERPKIRYSKRHTVLCFIARSYIDLAVLKTDAAAIGVIGHLRRRKFQNAALVIVVGAETRTPAFAIFIAYPEQSPELI